MLNLCLFEVTTTIHLCPGPWSASPWFSPSCFDYWSCLSCRGRIIPLALKVLWKIDPEGILIFKQAQLMLAAVSLALFFSSSSLSLTQLFFNKKHSCCSTSTRGGQRSEGFVRSPAGFSWTLKRRVLCFTPLPAHGSHTCWLRLFVRVNHYSRCERQMWERISCSACAHTNLLNWVTFTVCFRPTLPGESIYLESWTNSS